MDPRMELEAEYKKYIKVIKNHDSVFSGHVASRGQFGQPGLTEAEVKSAKHILRRPGCPECLVAELHCVGLLDYLEPDCERSKFRFKVRATELPQLDTPVIPEAFLAANARVLDPSSLPSYLALRKSYAAELKTLREHDGFFTKHNAPISPIWSGFPTSGEALTEFDLLTQDKRGLNIMIDNLNCATCRDAVGRALNALEILDPTIPQIVGRILDQERDRARDRLHDPSKCINNKEKFAAYERLVLSCWHRPIRDKSGSIPSAYDRDPTYQKFSDAIITKKPETYDIPCSDCKGHVHDAIQALLSDPDLCEKTTKKYREAQERERLAKEERIRNSLIEQERERLEKEKKVREILNQEAKAVKEKKELEEALLVAKNGTADAQYAVGLKYVEGAYEEVFGSPPVVATIPAPAEPVIDEEEPYLTQMFNKMRYCTHPITKQEKRTTYKVVQHPYYGTCTSVPDGFYYVPILLPDIKDSVSKLYVDSHEKSYSTFFHCISCSNQLNACYRLIRNSTKSDTEKYDMCNRAWLKTFGQ